MFIQHQSQFAFLKSLQRWLKWAFGGVPARFSTPGFYSFWSKSIPFKDSQLHVEDVQPGDYLDVLIDNSSLLVKTLELPSAARAHLAKTVDLQMRQTLPGSGQDLVWRYAIKERTGSHFAVEVLIVKRATLQSIVADASERGAVVRTISAADKNALPLLDNRKYTDRSKRFWLAANFCLILALAASVFWHEWRETSLLSGQLQQLKIEKSNLVDKVVKLREATEEKDLRLASIENDIAFFQSEHRRLPVLLDLTQELSDHTWISEVSIEAQEMRLSGFSSDEISMVISNLRKRDWVDRITIDGPVIFDNLARKNRFDLVILLTPLSGGM